MSEAPRQFVSRAGVKLEHALVEFGVDASGKTCADLGSNVGGFVDCLLRRGAVRVYSIDTGYGVLDWGLRNDPRVVVMERTNAMHVRLPETVALIAIDVAWTRQEKILPAAKDMLVAGGEVITLIKPHYEAEPRDVRAGVLREQAVQPVLEKVRQDFLKLGFEIRGIVESPIKGGKGNREWLAHLRLAPKDPA